MLMEKLLAVFCEAFGKYPAGTLQRQRHLLLSIYFRPLRGKVFLGQKNRTRRAEISRVTFFSPQEGYWGVFLAVNPTIPSQHLGRSSGEEKRRYWQTPEGTCRTLIRKALRRWIYQKEKPSKAPVLPFLPPTPPGTAASRRDAHPGGSGHPPPRRGLREPPLPPLGPGHPLRALPGQAPAEGGPARALRRGFSTFSEAPFPAGLPTPVCGPPRTPSGWRAVPACPRPAAPRLLAPGPAGCPRNALPIAHPAWERQDQGAPLSLASPLAHKPQGRGNRPAWRGGGKRGSAPAAPSSHEWAVREII